MNRTFASATAIALIASASLAQAALEFAGYLKTSKETRFNLVDTEKSESSRWLSIGQEFAGQTLAGFDQEKEVLTLRGPKGPLQLALRPSVVLDAKMKVSGTIEIGAGENIQVVQASLIIGEQNRFPLKDGVVLNIKPVRLPDGNLKYFSLLETTGPTGKKQVLGSPTVIARPGQSFGVQSGAFKYSFKP